MTKTTTKKPKAKLIGRDGNVFGVLGAASKALERAGLETQAGEMRAKVMASSSYGAALQIILSYVDAE